MIPMSIFSSRSFLTALAIGGVSLAVLGGCATPPPADDPDAVAEYNEANDPLEPMNRQIFAFNVAVDHAVMRPVAQAYRDYVPQDGRDRVRDFLRNLREPWILANDILQGDAERAGETLARFTLNTAVGLGGLVDVAGRSGLPYHDEDFGQTLAVWGVGEGPYLVLPILGPSNPRDAVGLGSEWLLDPVDFGFRMAGYSWAEYGRGALDGLDKREDALDPLDEIERTSIDFYSALRSLYRQHREAEIRNQPNVVPIPGLTDVSGKPPQISQESN